jgi:hypothetical protein
MKVPCRYFSFGCLPAIANVLLGVKATVRTHSALGYFLATHVSNNINAILLMLIRCISALDCLLCAAQKLTMISKIRVLCKGL